MANETGVVRSVAAPPCLPAPDVLAVQLEWGRTLVQSGVLPEHIKKPETVVAIVMTGRELGIPPMQALTNLYVVHGKVSCDTKTMLALAWRSGLLNRLEVLESADDHCTVEIQRNGGKAQRFTFTMHDADRLGVTKATASRPEKGAQYRGQPRVMLRWRCIAEALRVTVPDALSGLYTHEEMGLPVRVEDDDIVLDSKVLAKEESKVGTKAVITEGAAEITDYFGGENADPTPTATAETGGEVGTRLGTQAENPPTEPSHPVEPKCPKCGGQMSDNREDRKAAEAEIVERRRTKKAPPAWKCKSVDCGGVIWPSESWADLYPGIPEKPTEPITERQKADIKALCEKLGWKMGPVMELCKAVGLPLDVKKLSKEQAVKLLFALVAEDGKCILAQAMTQKRALMETEIQDALADGNLRPDECPPDWAKVTYAEMAAFVAALRERIKERKNA